MNRIKEMRPATMLFKEVENENSDSGNCSLQMECEDDTLSLAQVNDYRFPKEKLEESHNEISTQTVCSPLLNSSSALQQVIFQPGITVIKQEPGTDVVQEDLDTDAVQEELGTDSVQEPGSNVVREELDTDVFQERSSYVIKQEPGTDVQQQQSGIELMAQEPETDVAQLQLGKDVIQQVKNTVHMDNNMFISLPTLRDNQTMSIVDKSVTSATQEIGCQLATPNKISSNPERCSRKAPSPLTVVDPKMRRIMATVQVHKNKTNQILAANVASVTTEPTVLVLKKATAAPTVASIPAVSSSSPSNIGSNIVINTTSNTLKPKDQSYVCNVTITGGSIKPSLPIIDDLKVVSPFTVKHEIFIEQKMSLYEHLENEHFTTDPLKWWYRCGLFKEYVTCVCCANKLDFTGEIVDFDGCILFKNKCSNSKCGVIKVPQLKLFQSFLKKFNVAISKLHRLLFHWAAQSDTVETLADVNVDCFMMRRFFRSIREICIKVVEEKSEKLGGPSQILELGTARIGEHYIVCVMNHKSKLCRMKAISNVKPSLIPSLIRKTIEPWLKPSSSIMTTDPNMSSFNKPTLLFILVNKNSSNANNSVGAVNNYLKKVLTDTFGQVDVSNLKLSTIEDLLYEIQWRDRFGHGPQAAFWNMISEIAEQSGKKIVIPPEQLKIVTKFSLLGKTPRSLQSNADCQENSKQDDIASISSTENHQQSNSTDSASCNTLSRKSQSTRNTISLVVPPTSNTSLPDWENLSSFYYGTRPNLNLPLTGVFKFKCTVCKNRIFTCNIMLMYHVNAHVETYEIGKKGDLEGDFIQCKYCFKCFETDSLMQEHVDSVHRNATEMFCRICHHDYQNQSSLISHMTQNHVQQELPYVCQACTYRSSFYNDILDHFQQVHRDSDNLLCHFCLKTFKVTLPISNGPGVLQSYYYHIFMHRFNGNIQKCKSCCLRFLSISNVNAHMKRDHFSMSKLKGVLPFQNSKET